MRLSAALISICFLTLISSRLEASPVIFTDRAVFEAVVQSNALVTFDKVVSVDDPSVPASCANGLCQALVDDILRTSASGFDGLPRDGELPVFVSPTILTLEGGATFAAIGFDVSSDVMFFLDVAADGVFVPIPFTPEFSRFVGLSFSRPVSSVSVAYIPLRGFSPGIVDNMLIRTVPEPSTMLLFGSALALVQGVRCRRRIAVIKDRLSTPGMS